MTKAWLGNIIDFWNGNQHIDQITCWYTQIHWVCVVKRKKKFEWFIQTSCPFCKLKHVANHFFDFNCSHSHSFSINFCTIDSFYENTMWAFSARMNQKLSPSRLSSKLKLPYFNFDFINGMEPKLEASSWLFGRVNWKRKFKWIMAYNRCKISSDSFWNILGVSIFNSAKQ